MPASATTATATGTFEVSAMEEDTYQQLEGVAKLTHARGKQRLSGDLTGEGTVEWLMCYRVDGLARYVGLQRVVGSLRDRSGSFVIEARGNFDGAASKGTWSVIPGSGSGALAGLRGEGSFEAPGGPKASFALDYSLD
jgi:hypothetical protein